MSTGSFYELVACTTLQRAVKVSCDQQTQACTPIDMSLPAHAEATASDDDSYVWEYVKACTVDTQPCSPQHAPSVLLRGCPAGTVLISTQSRGFDPALQVRQESKNRK